VMLRRSFLLASLALAVGVTAAHAEPLAFTIDPNHSTVGFSVRHFFSRVSGRFKDFSGTVQYDEKNLAASSVDVTIQAATITTENDRRDADLRSSDFFAVDSFPTLTFKSTKVVPGSNGAFQIQGDLTMHGVTRPVTLEASLLGVGDVSMGGRGIRRVAGFEAKTTINRKDYGIVWNRTLDQGGTMLGDDVAITLSIEANAMKAAAQATDKAPPAAAEKK
jgi:polyisoprenoid-binding protein YceI